MPDSRHTAVLMLQEILEKGTFLTELKNRGDSQELKDGAFINMLLLTALRRLVYIRRILGEFVKKPLPPKQKAASYALILGTVELLYMNTPDYAAINSYVAIAKKLTDKYVGGFINAVLRKISAHREEILNRDKHDFFPPAFRKLLSADYSADVVNRIETAALAEPPLDLTARNNAADLAARLNGRLLPLNSVRLANAGSVTALDGYRDGLWWVQDFSAALPVKTIPALQNARVLDLCAAPGGKTAQLINAGARVTAVDISPTRLQTLRDNLQRLNLAAEAVVCRDALDYLAEVPASSFDCILLDAPCSATGTVRRHPELVHLKTAADVAKLTELQARLLDAAVPALKPDGFLIYCTCSLSKSEGEQQITAFIQRHPDFRPLAPELPSELGELLTPEGFIRVQPYHLADCGGADGFFVARLKKEAS